MSKKNQTIKLCTSHKACFDDKMYCNPEKLACMPIQSTDPCKNDSDCPDDNYCHKKIKRCFPPDPTEYYDSKADQDKKVPSNLMLSNTYSKLDGKLCRTSLDCHYDWKCRSGSVDKRVTDKKLVDKEGNPFVWGGSCIRNNPSKNLCTPFQFNYEKKCYDRCLPIEGFAFCDKGQECQIDPEFELTQGDSSQPVYFCHAPGLKKNRSEFVFDEKIFFGDVTISPEFTKSGPSSPSRKDDGDSSPEDEEGDGSGGDNDGSFMKSTTGRVVVFGGSSLIVLTIIALIVFFAMKKKNGKKSADTPIIKNSEKN